MKSTSQTVLGMTERYFLRIGDNVFHAISFQTTVPERRLTCGF